MKAAGHRRVARLAAGFRDHYRAGSAKDYWKSANSSGFSYNIFNIMYDEFKSIAYFI